MNIFHKVTIESLRKNKTRTIVTIIGIMLSAALICAVTTSVASFMNYAKENIIYNNGSWHASRLQTDLDTYRVLCEMEEIDEAVYGQEIGYAEIGSMNEYKPYLYIMGAGEGFADMLPVHITDGEFPDSADEILLPEHLAMNGGVHHRIGDALTLDIGERMLDGGSLHQKTPCYVYTQGDETELNGEVLTIQETRTYTVVGFYERPDFEDFDAPGYTAITTADDDAAGTMLYDVYYTLRKPKNTYSFVAEHQDYWGSTNDHLLMMQGSFQLDGMYGMLYGLAAIFIALIVFGSVSLIYNAFSISVSERTKQFGLLSSIGATRKQLRRMVFFEGFAVSAIGIPLGILVGIAGISVTLLAIGQKFSAAFETNIPMRICISPMAIVIACVVALFTVLISAWIPSIRATRVTAVEAIRQSADIKAEKKPIRTPKIVYKLFGLSGMLAHKHYKRSKKKYRATVVSLFMSIVLFISASAFTDYLMETAEGGFSTYGYDLRFYHSPMDTENMPSEEVLTLIREDEYVDAAAHAQTQSIMADVPKSVMTEQAYDMFGYVDTGTGEKLGSIHTTVYFVDDLTFRNLLKEHHLSETEFMNPDAPLAIAVDGYRIFDYKEQRYADMHVLKSDTGTFTYTHIRDFEGYQYQSIVDDVNGNLVYRYENVDNPDEYMELSEEEATVTFFMKSGKTIEEQPFFLAGETDFYLIYPRSVMESVVPEDRESYSHVFLMSSEQHNACYTSLKKKFTENRLTAVNLTDYAAEAEQERNIITIIQVFSYGFIVLISLIAAANVFNTISTNIALRRREFAMLRSIGMTNGGFNKMMNYECLLYGTKALLLGLPVSCIVTCLIYKAVGEGYFISFHLPWSAVGIAVLSVFAVVFATMLYAMSKVKKDNPIDALRNENL